MAFLKLRIFVTNIREGESKMRISHIICICSQESFLRGEISDGGNKLLHPNQSSFSISSLTSVKIESNRDSFL